MDISVEQKQRLDIDWDYYSNLAKQSRLEQGLPEKIIDPVVLKRVSELIKPSN